MKTTSLVIAGVGIAGVFVLGRALFDEGRGVRADERPLQAREAAWLSAPRAGGLVREPLALEDEADGQEPSPETESVVAPDLQAVLARIPKDFDPQDPGGMDPAVWMLYRDLALGFEPEPGVCKVLDVEQLLSDRRFNPLGLKLRKDQIDWLVNRIEPINREIAQLHPKWALQWRLVQLHMIETGATDVYPVEDQPTDRIPRGRFFAAVRGPNPGTVRHCLVDPLQYGEFGQITERLRELQGRRYDVVRSLLEPLEPK